MRVLGVLPIFAAIAACVLGFLCLFAGSKPNFMEEYHIINVNTSRIGQNLIDLNSEPSSNNDNSSNPLRGFLNNVTSTITSWIDNQIEEGITDVARELGINDFYSVHLMDYCEGWYTPTTMSNATFPESQIRKNVTECSNRTASYHFDLATILEERLNRSGVDISLDDLQFPDALQDGLDALAGLFTAAFALYCIGIGFSFLAIIFPLWFIFGSSHSVGRGRVAALVNLTIALLGFLAYGIASALATALTIKGSNVINEYGDDVGIEAERGSRFLAISWAACGLMFLNAIIWCGGCVVGRGKKTQEVKYG